MKRTGTFLAAAAVLGVGLLAGCGDKGGGSGTEVSGSGPAGAGTTAPPPQVAPVVQQQQHQANRMAEQMRRQQGQQAPR